jgi:hypothetical protein
MAMKRGTSVVKPSTWMGMRVGRARRRAASESLWPQRRMSWRAGSILKAAHGSA